jgi:hypothetical protein
MSDRIPDIEKVWKRIETARKSAASASPPVAPAKGLFSDDAEPDHREKSRAKAELKCSECLV